MDFNLARHVMLDQQIRPWEVTDERVLEACARSPREDYVPERYRALAFADMAIPLDHGQEMMTPKLEARLLQALELEVTDKVLEIGTGSGYVTSLLALLAAHVYSVEIVPEFTAAADKVLASHELLNVTLETGDGARGWSGHAPYDAILITGSTPILPEAFARSLAPGGRLIAIVGRSPVMDVRLIRRVNDEGFAETSLFETDLPPLVNALESARFTF